MTHRELVEWAAYYQTEPWGEQRADLRAGVIAATVANVHRPKGRRAFQPADFVLKFGKRRERRRVMAQSEIKGVFWAIAKAAGKHAKWIKKGEAQ